MRYPRPMSFSDRQFFIQCLAETRNLSAACAAGEQDGSDLQTRRDALNLAIDGLMGELVGDASYLRIKDHPSHG